MHRPRHVKENGQSGSCCRALWWVMSCGHRKHSVINDGSSGPRSSTRRSRNDSANCAILFQPKSFLFLPERWWRMRVQRYARDSVPLGGTGVTYPCLIMNARAPDTAGCDTFQSFAGDFCVCWAAGSLLLHETKWLPRPSSCNDTRTFAYCCCSVGRMSSNDNERMDGNNVARLDFADSGGKPILGVPPSSIALRNPRRSPRWRSYNCVTARFPTGAMNGCFAFTRMCIPLFGQTVRVGDWECVQCHDVKR